MVALGLALLCLVGLVHQQVKSPDYTASATIALEPQADRAVPSATMIRLLATKYVSYASSPATVRRVAGDTRGSSQRILDGVSVTMAPATTNLLISVTTANRGLSSRAAQELSAAVTAWSAHDPVLKATTVVQSEAPVHQASLRDTVTVGLFAVVGLVCLLVALAGLRGVRLGSRRRTPRGPASHAAG